MQSGSHSAALKRANVYLRFTLKPMLRFIASQRLLNWITHRQAVTTGLPFDAAECVQVSLRSKDRALRALKAVPKALNHADACILYFHGGAYTLGSPMASEADARRLAICCGMPVYSAQYRTAIHAPYPAAVNDAEVAYLALLEQGFAADQIVLAGTSAGGGLALALLHRLIAQGSPLPACVVTLSPWLDLSLSQSSIDRLARRDVILSRAWLARAAKLYSGTTPLDHPELSPLRGGFEGSPPQMLLYSEVEVFRDEIIAFAEKLTSSGVEITLHAQNHAPHAWPVVVHTAPESAEAFEEIAGFIAQHIA